MDKQFDLSEFIAFVASKPADEEYDSCDSYRCALAQYGAATGNVDLIGPRGTRLIEGMGRAFMVAIHGEDGREPTFGALSERLSRLSAGEG